MLKEAIEAIVDLSNATRQLRVMELPDGQHYVLQLPDGLTEIKPLEPDFEALILDDLDSVVDLCADRKISELFINETDIFGGFGRLNKESVCMRLNGHLNRDLLAKLEAGVCLSQAQAVRFVRKDLGLPQSGVVNSLRKITWSRSATAHAENSRDSMGMMVDRQATSTNDIPEQIPYDARLWNPPMPPFMARIDIQVDLDLENERIEFWTPPGTTAAVAHSCVVQLQERLTEKLTAAEATTKVLISG